MARGSMIAVHSTVSPKTCQSLAKVAAEHGVTLIDTPVSGGAKLAEAGQMVVMIGRGKASFEICRDISTTFATTIVHLGDVRAGLFAKAINNALIDENVDFVHHEADEGWTGVL